MSRVFVAEETALDRKVVIKVLPPETAAQVSLERFKREILLAAKLQHPHIVPLLTAGESNGLPYFTMPFVDGESLRVRLARHGELPVNQAIRMLREIASALAYAHEHGIVHRDIKPENVLLSGGSAMVTDFGVAKALSASSSVEHGGLTSLGVALGTPAYMSPEQASADPSVDHRTDIYSLGVLAYELLTGQPPFAGRTPQNLLAARLTAARARGAGDALPGETPSRSPAERERGGACVGRHHDAERGDDADRHASARGVTRRFAPVGRDRRGGGGGGGPCHRHRELAPRNANRGPTEHRRAPDGHRRRHDTRLSRRRTVERPDHQAVDNPGAFGAGLLAVERHARAHGA